MGFWYATSLDLNIVYYHIQPRKTQATYVRLFFRGGGYWYKHLPTGVENSPDIFQQKMNYLFHGF